MRKYLQFVLCLLMMFSLFVAVGCEESPIPDPYQTTFTQENITIRVGDRLQMKTADGVLYDTYGSENPQIAEVSATGVLSGVAAGETRIFAEIGTDNKIYCSVTVTEKIETEETADYHIDVADKILVPVGSEELISATVKKGGVVVNEDVEWIAENSQVVSFVASGNALKVKGLSNGKQTVKVKKGNFEASITIKCYDDAHVLSKPAVGYADGKLTWTGIANADGYKVTVDGGANWIELPAEVTEYAVKTAYNALNVGVVATAGFDSEYVDSIGILPFSYGLSGDELKSVVEECGTATGTDEMLITPGGNAGKFGKTLFNVYGTDKSLLNNEKTSAFANLSIVFDVKGSSGSKISFVAEDESGNVSVSTFIVTDSWSEVGYKLNSYVEKCYVALDGESVSVRDFVVTKDNAYPYSSTYTDIVESAGNLAGFEAKLLNNYAYLSVSEKELLNKKYSSEIKSILASYRTEDKPLDIKFIGKALKVSNITNANGQSGGDKINAELIPDPLTGTVFAVGIHANYRHYISALPEADPGYDYYIFRLYNSLSADITDLRVGDKGNVTLKPGWNSIEITYGELTYYGKPATQNFWTTAPYSAIKLGSCYGVVIKDPNLIFIDKEMSAGDFGANASIVKTDDAVTGTFKAIKLDGSSRSYASLLPAADPGYDYYEWRLYNNGGADTLRVGGLSGISFANGWNTVVITWEQLNDSTKNIYKEGGYYSQLYVGALIGKYYPNPNFLDKEMKESDFGAGASSVKIEDDETGTQRAIQPAANARSYASLLPAEDPGFNHYEWRVYNAETADVTIRIGGKSGIVLSPGWNTVTLTWTQLNDSTKNLYKDAYYSRLYVGELRGVNESEPDPEPENDKVKFLDTVMKAEDFGAKAQMIDLVDEVAGTVNAIKLDGSSRSYASLLPAADPGFDYYEWRVYNADTADVTIRIGGKNGIVLKSGWNTVTLTWAQLNDSTKNFYKDAYYSKLCVGTLAGCRYPTLKFIDKDMTAADFGAKAVLIDLVDELTLTQKAVKLDGSSRSYASLLPAADPGYDYYEWRVYNADTADVTIRIGGKNGIVLKSGWNTVTLTWAQLNDSTKNFYKDAYYSKLCVGTLKGCNN